MQGTFLTVFDPRSMTTCAMWVTLSGIHYAVRIRPVIIAFAEAMMVSMGVVRAPIAGGSIRSETSTMLSAEKIAVTNILKAVVTDPVRLADAETMIVEISMIYAALTVASRRPEAFVVSTFIIADTFVD
jgi:hypothetical protein